MDKARGLQDCEPWASLVGAGVGFGRTEDSGSSEGGRGLLG